jgi:hypothetical protein
MCEEEVKKIGIEEIGMENNKNKRKIEKLEDKKEQGQIL